MDSEAHIGIGVGVPASMPKRGPTGITRQPAQTKFRNKKRACKHRFQARSVIPGGLGKPPLSAAQPPHRIEIARGFAGFAWLGRPTHGFWVQIESEQA
jgi:hypothetical protein